MSIKPQPIAEIPALTQQVAKAAFPKGNPYLTLRDELGTVFKGHLYKLPERVSI